MIIYSHNFLYIKILMINVDKVKILKKNLISNQIMFKNKLLLKIIHYYFIKYQ